MAFDNHDIVSDILKRVARSTGAGVDKLMPVEKEIRGHWGGERCYIAKAGEDARMKLCARDEAIRRDFRRGAHEALLARRWDISVRRVRQIIRLNPAE